MGTTRIDAFGCKASTTLLVGIQHRSFGTGKFNCISAATQRLPTT